MHRGEIGKSVLQLEVDLRRVMEPYTALNLKVSIVLHFQSYTANTHSWMMERGTLGQASLLPFAKEVQNVLNVLNI